MWSGARSLGSAKLVKSYLVRRNAPGSQSQSSHTRSGSSLPCRRRCFDRGCSSTVWEAPWSRRAWPRPPSGSRRGAGRPYSVHRWTDPECSPRSRSWAMPSTPRWGTPSPACSPVNLPGKDCHLSPGSHFLQGPCKQYAGCWWKWCLKKKKKMLIFQLFIQQRVSFLLLSIFLSHTNSQNILRPTSINHPIDLHFGFLSVTSSIFRSVWWTRSPIPLGVPCNFVWPLRHWPPPPTCGLTVWTSSGTCKETHLYMLWWRNYLN